MVDNKVLALDIASKVEFTPMDDRILVKPMKPTMITKLLPTAPKDLPKSADEAEGMEPTEPTKQKVEANIYKGIVLKLGTEYAINNPQGIEAGDIVFFHRQSGMPFELLKDSRLLRRYEVLGIHKYELDLVL
jgi:hypothetical protein